MYIALSLLSKSETIAIKLLFVEAFDENRENSIIKEKNPGG